HAVDIAKIARKLTQEFYLKAPLVDIGPLANMAHTMVLQSLQSLVRHDLALAVQVCDDDDQVDAAFKHLREELLELTQQEPSRIFPASYLLLAVVYLERIADHATNIAERVYYIETGDRKPLGRREARDGS
ncbi:MAG: phosphate signaling complex PhoU family protein, partial [Janthinobacterium lividum]